MKKLSRLAGRYMALLSLGVAILSFVFPGQISAAVKTSYINPLLMLVMFGMGLTLKPADFKVVFTHPRDVLLGEAAQFLIMPLLAFILASLFRLPTELALGVILVGACPGGTSSNVMTYLAKGDVALSVGMTAVSTLLAPVITPFLSYAYAGQSVDVNAGGMFLSILQVVLLPVAAGLVLRTFFARLTQYVTDVLPLISVTAILLIIAAVVSANAEKLLRHGLLIVFVVVLHNCGGYALGFWVGRLLHLDEKKKKTLAIEVGMQNSGLATSLAATHFAAYPLATIPGAVFSVWHNISGAVFSNWMAKKEA